MGVNVVSCVCNNKINNNVKDWGMIRSFKGHRTYVVLSCLIPFYNFPMLRRDHCSKLFSQLFVSSPAQMGTASRPAYCVNSGVPHSKSRPLAVISIRRRGGSLLQFAFTNASVFGTQFQYIIKFFFFDPL